MKTIHDLDAVLALNNAHAEQTSPLTGPELAALIDQAAVALGDGAGFVLALDPGAVYASENFAWFKARFAKFLYVDRIVIGAQGRGLGRKLYDRVFDAARALGQGRVVAEVNRIPANPVSDAFHAALGFEEIGAAWTKGHSRYVRYLVRGV